MAPDTAATCECSEHPMAPHLRGEPPCFHAPKCARCFSVHCDGAVGGPCRECPGCGGTGIGGYVSWEAASDAGEPSMEGQPIPCSCVPVWTPDASGVPF